MTTRTRPRGPSLPVEAKLQMYRNMVTEDETEWKRLLKAFKHCPDTMRVDTIGLMNYDFLPEPRPQRITVDRLIEAIKVGPKSDLQIRQEKKILQVSTTDIVAKADGDTSGSSESDSSTSSEAGVKKTKLQVATMVRAGPRATKRNFKEVVNTFTTADAVRTMREATVSRNTLKAYKPAIKLYRDMCKTKGYVPFPLIQQRLEAFGGFLRISGYKSIGTYLAAIIWYNRNVLQTNTKDVKFFTKELKMQSERDIGKINHAEPYTANDLILMSKMALDQQDIDRVLQEIGQFFTLSRKTCFVNVKKEKITIKDKPRRLTINLTNPKGTRRQREHIIEYEPLDNPLVLEFGDSARTRIPFCPFVVLATMKQRGNEEFLVRRYNEDPQVLLDAILLRCGLSNKPDGRGKRFFTPHSARAGGSCALLKCGLREIVLQTLGSWRSLEMVQRYTQVVSLQPGVFQGFPFFNPKSGRGNYSEEGDKLDPNVMEISIKDRAGQHINGESSLDGLATDAIPIEAGRHGGVTHVNTMVRLGSTTADSSNKSTHAGHAQSSTETRINNDPKRNTTHSNDKGVYGKENRGAGRIGSKNPNMKRDSSNQSTPALMDMRNPDAEQDKNNPNKSGYSLRGPISDNRRRAAQLQTMEQQMVHNKTTVRKTMRKSSNRRNKAK